jgi:methylated-DNA-[protein]-cysteine S-methyltransferase
VTKETDMTATITATDQLIHDTVDTPYGPLLLVAGSGGLVRVAFESEGFDRVLARVGGVAEPADGRLDHVRAQLQEYFAGKRRHFDVELDLSGLAGFRRRALEVMSAIPYGETRTYRELAESAGNPAAVRAAGSACATNPWPVLVPCHRVLRTGGGLGGYLGGLEMKRGLLALESRGAWS